MGESIVYGSYVDTQIAYDRHNFTLWCYNLFELNERLFTELSLSQRLYVNDNGYMLRSYFVVLWEIIYSGKKYLYRQEDKTEKHLLSIFKMIEEISDIITDDDYFMIKYYRNCSSHIFLNSYSVLDEKDTAKDEYAITKFYKKNGEKYTLTYDEILTKVEKVFGSRLGISEEPRYKKKLIRKLFPIIHKYYMEIILLDAENDKAFNELMGL